LIAVLLDNPSFRGGTNLTATKARLVKFGALPPAADPDNPTSAESAAVGEKVGEDQAVFDTH
jgi:L-asparaginase